MILISRNHYEWGYVKDLEEDFGVLFQGSLLFIHLNRLKKLHGLNPRANYTDRATAACRQSDCQLLRLEGATWSA
jgi:hypothetical protein